MLTTRVALRSLTKTEPCRRAPLAKIAILVYKAEPTTAPAKAPPKTSLFGERGLSRCYPTKGTSPDAPTTLPRTVALSPVDQDH